MEINGDSTVPKIKIEFLHFSVSLVKWYCQIEKKKTELKGKLI